MVLEGIAGKIISFWSGSEHLYLIAQHHKNEALGSDQNHRWFSVHAGFMYQKSETYVTTTPHRVNFSLQQLHMRYLTFRLLMSYIYIYDISSLRVNDLTLILLTWRKSWANNASKKQMGFNWGLKGLMTNLALFSLSSTRGTKYWDWERWDGKMVKGKNTNFPFSTLKLNNITTPAEFFTFGYWVHWNVSAKKHV
jgi:hypothetical protein